MKIDEKTVMNLYRTMVRIRTCEESFVEPILSKEIRCPVHLCTGQEAVAVGICSALETEDYIFGNHRSHGHYLAKGGGMRELVAEVFCRETGCSRGRGGSMHLIDPSVGLTGSAPIVAGPSPWRWAPPSRRKSETTIESPSVFSGTALPERGFSANR